MPPTPERAWRQWVKPAVRPRPIASTAPASAPPHVVGSASSHAPAARASAPSAPPMGSLAEEAVRVEPPGGEWRDAWRDDYVRSAALLQEQQGFLQALHSQPQAAMPPAGDAESVAGSAPHGPTYTPPPVPVPVPVRGGGGVRSTPGGGSMGGGGRHSSLGPSEWSPGPSGTLGASASLGASTVASSRLSYQWPTNLSIGTLHATDSNLSTPSQGRGGSTRYASSYGGAPGGAPYGGGHGFPYGGGGATSSSLRGSAYAAGQHAASAWYQQRGGGGMGGGGSAAGGPQGSSGSSSMVSLHNVRLSSWGSLPSRSSSSPAHHGADGGAASGGAASGGAPSGGPPSAPSESQGGDVADAQSTSEEAPRAAP